jgi:hypothetical protein
MAELVATVKRVHRLTETSILHILDINIHLSQQDKTPNMSPMPESDEELAERLGIDTGETETTDATGATDDETNGSTD